MKTLNTLIAVLILLIACRSASAGILPSFSPEYCPWKATDIVVVSEEIEMNGEFCVLETIKGDLKSGDTISIPEMSEFKSRDNRLITTSWSKQEQDENSTYVTGNRMILFLSDNKKTSQQLDDKGKTNAKTKTDNRWSSANLLGHEVKYSSVWIENGEVYGFSQRLSFSLLCDLRMTESKLRDQVSEVLKTQNAFNDACAAGDPVLRAKRLEHFTHDFQMFIRQEALKNITDIGEPALPVLRQMMDDESIGGFRRFVIEAFATAGGKSAGPELTKWIEKEMVFWMRTAPTLQKDWQSGDQFEEDQQAAQKAVEPLRGRWTALYSAVYALRVIKYAEAEDVLTRLRDFWSSMPQLTGDQVSEECDKFLREFGSIRK